MTYERLDVPVTGGVLRVGRWAAGAAPAAAPIVICAHGITGNHLIFRPLAEALVAEDVATVIAPDLRGRGRSNSLPGPYSMQVHADDAAAVLDHLGVAEPVTFLGQSMGGFVALAMAGSHSSRLRNIVLVDGGPRLESPPGLDIDAHLDALLGPAIARLAMTFTTAEAYLEWWRPHPAVASFWGPDFEEYLRYDLVGEAPELRSSVSEEAVRQDTLNDLSNDPLPLRTGVPTVMLRAERGIMDEPGGVYPLAMIEPIVAEAGVRLETVRDTNHYSLIWSRHGVDAIVRQIREGLDG